MIAGLWIWVAVLGVYTPKLGLDLQGGTSLTLEATAKGKAPDQEKLEEARDIIAARVNDTGVAESEVLIEGNRNIVINVPGQDADLEKVGEPAELRFRQVLEQTENVPAAKPSPTPSASGSASPTGSKKPSAKPSDSPKPSGSAKPTGSAKPSGSKSASASPTDPSREALKNKVYAKVGNGDPKKGKQLVEQIPTGIKDPKEIAQQPEAMKLLAPFGKLSGEELAVLPADVQFKVPTVTCKQLNTRPPGSIQDPKDQV
ncbi:MAG: protein translocase subunit SecD, partial [Micromonosporaceae bacterium]